ncbi:hypothetical protein ZIOFF_035013 [Zingiber officinale]|uniref:MADS-box domain-containing protein n=1 Tax=Zingiber officinale TaxID=94328 RepID=A0A8J5GB19_ZINOF|nr:hypothetical protein ZIOFF_035013 [Zingiber officinale]
MVRGRKTTRGKQKIEIKKIEDEDARYISFSKRRNGIYAKASDLATLCGVEIAVVVFSPTGRPHSFGSPSVMSIMDRFVSGDPYRMPNAIAGIYQRKQMVKELNQQLTEVVREFEEIKAQRAALEQRRAEAIKGLEWMDNIAGMGRQELFKAMEFLENIKFRAEARLREHLSMAGAGNTSAAGGRNALVPRNVDAFSAPASQTPVLRGGGGAGGYVNATPFNGGGLLGAYNYMSILTSVHRGVYVNPASIHGGGFPNSLAIRGGGGGGGAAGGYMIPLTDSLAAAESEPNPQDTEHCYSGNLFDRI